MIDLLAFFIALILVAISVIGGMTIFSWIAHIVMVRTNTNSYGYAGYKKFKEQFSKKNWIPFNGDVHSYDFSSKTTGDIFQFE